MCHLLGWQACWLAGEGVLLWWGVRKAVQLLHALFGCSQHDAEAWFRARFLRLAGVVCAVCPVQGHCALLGKVVVGCSRCCHCCLRWWVHLCSISCFRCDVHAAPFCSMQGCCCNVSAIAVAVRRLLLLPCGERHLSQSWCPSLAVLKRCWPQQCRCQAHGGRVCASWRRASHCKLVPTVFCAVCCR